MEVDWHWVKNKEVLRKEEKENELWRVWWTICTTRIKRKIK